MTEFESLNHSPGKRVLNYLKTICLRCGNSTGSFEVKTGADIPKFTNVIIINKKLSCR